MAELADAADSKSAEGNLVGVRPPLPAPIESMIYQINASSDAFFCAQTVPKVMKVIRCINWWSTDRQHDARKRGSDDEGDS